MKYLKNIFKKNSPPPLINTVVKDRIRSENDKKNRHGLECSPTKRLATDLNVPRYNARTCDSSGPKSGSAAKPAWRTSRRSMKTKHAKINIQSISIMTTRKYLKLQNLTIEKELRVIDKTTQSTFNDKKKKTYKHKYNSIIVLTDKKE